MVQVVLGPRRDDDVERTLGSRSPPSPPHARV